MRSKSLGGGTGALAGGLLVATLASGQASSPQSPSVQTPPPAHGTGLDLMDVDVMFIGAHPDDDGGIIATFARYLRDQGYRGTVITLTGGEGGGNAIGREAGRALGLIREEEERRSLALAGVTHPHFLGLRDFYFTLSAEETETRWGRDFICDVVRHVRLERPEVMVTMWPGPGTHGQHQMAARAATLAYGRAGDPAFCPDHITRELLSPFEPLKLYYYPNDRDTPGVLAVPTNEYSPAAGMRYADLKSLATWNYRSQGYDRLVRFPAENANPEQFLLVRSRVPREDKEEGFFSGTHRPAGESPAGVKLVVEPARFEVGLGSEVGVEVRLDAPGLKLEGPVLALKAPAGWSVSPSGPPAPGPKATFRVSPGPSAVPEGLARLEAEYRALHDGREVRGRNFALVRVAPPLRAAFRPLHDIAGYREFARTTRTEWVIPSLPARIPLAIGRTTRVGVAMVNDTAAAAHGELRLEAPEGIRLEGSGAFAGQGPGASEAAIQVRADPAALPEGRHSARVPATLVSRVGEVVSRDRADLYLLPSLSIPRATRPPVVDGDLADIAGYARGAIGPKDLWSRREPSGPDDLSAEFFLAWDAQALYVGVRVRDEAVVCNIAPDDVRAQLRSDSVGITVDPSGQSRDTSTTFQAAAFPCTTDGFAARGFRDADADQGLFEEKAKGARVASRRTESGFDIEFALPWLVMPAQPKPGAEIAVNVVLYDGDQKDARPGANINESGLAWAAFELGGKQALPYLWPRVTLSR